MFGQSTKFGKNNGVSGPRGFVGIYPLKHLNGLHIVTACRATYYTKLSTNTYPITSLFAVVLFLRYISVAGLVQCRVRTSWNMSSPRRQRRRLYWGSDRRDPCFN